MSTKRWITSLVLIHFLTALVLAASPALHHAIHHDADEADHACAVTAIVQGSFDGDMPSVECPSGPLGDGIPFIPQFCEYVPIVERVGAVLGRAPPVTG